MINSGDLPAMPLSGGSEPFHGYQGMTKREMIAMHMMAHLMQNDRISSYGVQAEFAIKAADALLAELERTK